MNNEREEGKDGALRRQIYTFEVRFSLLEPPYRQNLSERPSVMLLGRCLSPKSVAGTSILDKICLQKLTEDEVNPLDKALASKKLASS